MSKLWNNISISLAVVGGFIASMLGGWDILTKSLVVLIITDYITGIAKAIYTKELSSYVGFRGIIKKFIIITVIVLSVILQGIIQNAVPIRQITIMFFICNEGISILENSAVIVPLPKKLKDILIQLRDKNKDD